MYPFDLMVVVDMDIRNTTLPTQITVPLWNGASPKLNEILDLSRTFGKVFRV